MGNFVLIMQTVNKGFINQQTIHGFVPIFYAKFKNEIKPLTKGIIGNGPKQFYGYGPLPIHGRYHQAEKKL